MKIRNIFSLALAASALLLASCTKETATDSFDNINLDQTYLIIPEEGGSVKLTVNSTEEWKFVKDAKWPEVLTFAKDADGKTYKATTDRWGNITNPEEQISGRKASWLTASVLEGAAGITEVTFSAEAVAGGHEQAVAIVCGDHLQHVIVRQGTLEASQASCKEVIEGPDSKTYRVKGTCTAIANTTYGNWYLDDGTGSIYIYGTLDKEGKSKNFESLEIEVGDVVEVEGPKTTYGSVVELVDVTVLKITKSLVKVVTEPKEFSDLGTYDEEKKKHVPDTVKVAYKGGDFGYIVPENCQDWLSVVSVSNVKGVPSKLEQNPADTAYVAIKVLENAASEDRSASIGFSSSTSSVSYSLVQKGVPVGVTYFEAPFSTSQDGFTEAVELGDLASVWKLDSSKGYMKASAYSGSNHAAESLFVSPEIDLTGSKGAALTFNHALNFVKSGNKEEHIFVMARKSGEETWNKLEITTYPSGSSWDFVECSIDLGAYDNSKMQIAFKYVSTTEVAPTWEVKNVKISGK